ncbi:hypothetical protein [Cognatishimia sp. F0-27]|uniref:hypothetical protein n=1 Tax=Cognatishimia sp. F0-27 TaxID=2816855 RepID=UPI001D0C51E8|nr:hypothetical protein [Cognatishimia sp. F0-27]MCC1494895.1 hypothetical protein [Cognatishimia sp. F0-27]
MSYNVTPLNTAYRTVVDLSEPGALAVIPKTAGRMGGAVEVDTVVGDAVVLRYEDGTKVTLAHL